MVGLGIGEIIGAILFGYIEDHFSNRVSTCACLLLSTIAVVVNLVFTYNYSFTLGFGAIMCCMWGVQDGASNCLVSCILGF